MSNATSIGSVVRVPRDCFSTQQQQQQQQQQTLSKNLKNKFGRAVIATVDEDYICVFWENSSTPQPIIDWNDETRRNDLKKHHFLNKKFLVTPLFLPLDAKQDNDDGKEFTISTKNILPLLDFEHEVIHGSTSSISPREWKDRADQLLRLGDATAAIPYYEAALAMTSKIQVGGSALIQRKGRTVVVDVDCINEEDDTTTTVDVTFTNEEGEEEEVVVKENQLLLCLRPHRNNEDDGNGDSLMQQKILLNLSRCLLQLAEIDFADTVQNRPFEYRKATVLACSMVLAVSSFQTQESSMTTASADQIKLDETALLLRSKGQAGRSKWKHAIADIQRILKQHPNHVEAKKVLQQIQYQRTKQQKTDKKLSKAICKLVNKAATASDDKNEEGDDRSNSSTVSHSHSESIKEQNDHTRGTQLKHAQLETILLLTQFLLPCVIALFMFYLLQKYRF